jgi:hypothetical protein
MEDHDRYARLAHHQMRVNLNTNQSAQTYCSIRMDVKEVV